MVEMVVYIGILTIATTLIVNGLLSISRSYRDLRLTKNISTSATSALQRLTYEIRQAQSIDTAQSTFAANPSILTLNSPLSDGIARTVKFSVTNGILRVSVNGVDEGPVTASNITVSNFTLKQVSNALSQGVVVTLGLQGVFGTKSLSETFYTTAVLRNVY